MGGCAVAEAHDLGQRPVDVHVVALRGLQVFTQELGGGVVGGSAVTQDVSGLDLIGDQVGNLGDSGDLRDVVRGRG